MSVIILFNGNSRLVCCRCLCCYYEGESVNRSQMDIKRKTREIQTWKNHLFLDICSINIYTLVPSFYQCVEIRSIEVF
jgi:hypothetical protein